MFLITAIWSALETAFFMFWQILWPLALGFLISAVIEVFVSRERVVSALGRDNLRGISTAALLGAASSSCSYAAVAIARSLFRKGATFANSILFEFASTNLVFELGVVLLVLLGWQFVAAEFAGGLLMIGLLAIIFKYTLRARLVERARRQADKGLRGRMEGHAEMDHSVTDGPFLRRILSDRGFTAMSQAFYMGVASIAQDLVLGLLIAGALAAWVPDRFWQTAFLTNNPNLGAVWGPIIGPIISLLSFVCSVGNVPLAVVLWNGGISFGGVISFIFADLIIIPILNIHRKYYGGRASLYLLGTSYVAIALAGFIIGSLFQLLGLAPAHHHVAAFQTAPSWDYTTFLNLLFLAIAAVLGWRFLRTGGVAMLRAMEHPPERGEHLDPVCGMTVSPPTAAGSSTYGGRTYYFCSSGCKVAFDKDPELYAARAGHPSHHD